MVKRRTDRQYNGQKKKDRQHNGQKKVDRQTNNNLQNINLINVNIMTLFVFLCLSEIKKILFSGPNGEMLFRNHNLD
jgi:hypothetical protein